MKLQRILLAAALLGPAAAGAQDQEDVLVDETEDQAKTRTPLATGARFLEDPLEALVQSQINPKVGEPAFRFTSASEVHSFENRDLQELDESTDQRVIDTDDRRTFGHTDITATVAYRPDTRLKFDTQLKYDLLWRDDGLGRSSNSPGVFNVYRLSAAYDLAKSDAFSLKLKVGRQPFSIGGVPKDYMLSGTLDAVVLNADFGDFGGLRILAVDFFGGHDQPVSGYQFFRDGSETVFGLRGDTNTLRHGAIYEYDRKLAEGQHFDLKAYYFYASIGGGPIDESGADITYGGTLGNFRDNDYQHLRGLRAKYDLDFGDDAGSLTVFGEFANSEGLDRKPVVERDVKTGGNAYGGGAEVSIRAAKSTSIYLGVDAYHFDGAQYGSDGLEFERGFVGFRGSRLGGLTVGRQSSWRPSAHMDAYGIDHTPQDISRSAGTFFVHAAGGARMGHYAVRLDWWMYQDTSSTFLDVDNIDAIPDPPFGRSRAEFEAQARFGKTLGQEINVELSRKLGKHMRLYANYGAFMPGEYYDVKVNRVAGERLTALGGDATFWATRFGAMVNF